MHFYFALIYRGFGLIFDLDLVDYGTNHDEKLNLCFTGTITTQRVIQNGSRLH